MTDKNTTEYKEYVKDYNKNYYINKRQLPHEPAWVKRKNKSLMDGTKKQYIKIIRRLHGAYSDKLNTDLEDVLNKIFSGGIIDTRDYKYIKSRMYYMNTTFLEKLKEKYTNTTSLKVNLIPYTTLLSYLSANKYFEKLHTQYSKYIISLNKDYETERDDNFVSESDKNKIITDFSKDTILSNMDKLDNVDEKLVYGLYTLIPPRRLEYLKVYLVPQSYKIKDERNYLVIKKKVPERFIFQDYKTSNSYGRVEVSVPDELKSVIQDYIIKHKVKSNMLFINMNITKYIRLVKSAFNKIYDADISVRWIRISYATYIDRLNISNNDKKELALKMGHSISMSGKYKKLI
jgi:hypothetical protein